MKKNILPLLLIPAIIALLFLLTKRGSSSADYFNGQIEYRYTYISDSLDVDSLSKIKPYKSIFRFDKLNYQSTFFEKDTLTYFYLSQINKAISKTNSKINERCEDYGLPTDSILAYKLYNTDEKIVGYNCLILEFESNNFHTRYWVNNDLRITPATYKQHTAFNWRFYGEKTNGALILKTEHRFKNYTMVGTAVAIIPQNKNFTALEIDEHLIKQICNN